MKRTTSYKNERMKAIRIMAVVITVLAMLALTACGGAPDSAQENAGQQIQGNQTDEVQESASGTSGSENTAPSDGIEGTDGSQNTAPLQNESAQNAGGSAGGTSGDIGAAQVQAIVLARVPGSTAADIYELEREYDDGRLEYEGSLYYNGYEYEFEIDGATGNILKWEIDD